MLGRMPLAPCRQPVSNVVGKGHIEQRSGANDYSMMRRYADLVAL